MTALGSTSRGRSGSRAASGLAQLRENAQRVRYLLYGRAMPVAEPYPVNRIDEVRRALGLEHALASP